MLLQQFVRRLEDQVNVTNPSKMTSTQASAMRTEALFHNLGSFLLELGRTIMTLQLGQTPSKAMENAGPVVFISPIAPNPIMVQPLPFQVGKSFGTAPMGQAILAHGRRLFLIQATFLWIIYFHELVFCSSYYTSCSVNLLLLCMNLLTSYFL